MARLDKKRKDIVASAVTVSHSRRRMSVGPPEGHTLLEKSQPTGRALVLD